MNSLSAAIPQHVRRLVGCFRHLSAMAIRFASHSSWRLNYVIRSPCKDSPRLLFSFLLAGGFLLQPCILRLRLSSNLAFLSTSVRTTSSYCQRSLQQRLVNRLASLLCIEIGGLLLLCPGMPGRSMLPPRTSRYR